MFSRVLWLQNPTARNYHWNTPLQFLFTLSKNKQTAQLMMQMMRMMKKNLFLDVSGCSYQSTIEVTYKLVVSHGTAFT